MHQPLRPRRPRNACGDACGGSCACGARGASGGGGRPDVLELGTRAPPPAARVNFGVVVAGGVGVPVGCYQEPGYLRRWAELLAGAAAYSHAHPE